MPLLATLLLLVLKVRLPKLANNNTDPIEKKNRPIVLNQKGYFRKFLTFVIECVNL